MNRFVVIPETHQGLHYKDGRFVELLGPGLHELPVHLPLPFRRTPQHSVALVDIRERDLTLKGQEILTGDKVALRVSILVQFRVTDAKAALHAVANYEDRLYSDVQLAARRSLASMPLEQILTNRNRLNEDIRAEVTESASGYGVTILRADVKDLAFPGNLQEVMNRVLTAERLAQAQLVEARTAAEIERLQAEARAAQARAAAEAGAHATRVAAEAQAEAVEIRARAEAQAVVHQQAVAAAYGEPGAMLRLRELEALQELAKNARARLFLSFPKGGRPAGRLKEGRRD